MRGIGALLGLALLGCASADPAHRGPLVLHESADLNISETARVGISGQPLDVKLIGLKETLDDVNGAVRQAQVTLEVDGKTVTLTSGLYHLPVTVGPLQIDCPITKGYVARSQQKNPWGCFLARW